MTAIEFMDSFSNLNYAGIFNYIEEMVFMIKINQAICTRIGYLEGIKYAM